MSNDAINVWWNPEDTEKDPRIFVGIKARGNMMLRHDSYDLVLFLTEAEADELSFKLGSILQDVERARKETKKE